MSLLLIGCGKMGGALLEGWLTQGVPARDVTIVEPNQQAACDFVERLGVNAIASADELASDYAPEVVVIAVKPQIMAEVLPPYAKLTAAKPVFLSIAAGKTIASFEAILGASTAIVRAMPNTPASVGRGITVGCPNANVTGVQAALCKRLLSAVGEVEWIDDEALLDAVTALSGSGPAYIFLLAEAMGHAGRMAGLPPELADKLARATVAGSGELLHQSPLPAATLRENVTSPNGTTAAALDVLMGAHGLKELMTQAIDAATRRSKELAS